MIKCFLICFIGVYALAVDLEGLKKEKILYKKEICSKSKKINQKKLNNIKRIVIIFKHVNISDIKYIEKEYSFQLEECFAKKICIFNVEHNIDLAVKFIKLKEEKNNIEEIKPYKIHQFQIY